MLEHLGARGVGRRWCLCQAGDLVLTWPLGGPRGLCKAGRELGLLLGAGKYLLYTTRTGLFSPQEVRHSPAVAVLVGG